MKFHDLMFGERESSFLSFRSEGEGGILCFKSMEFAPATLQSLHRVGFPKGDLSWMHILG